ncbi:hypothetical protein L1987_86725 [Smallanthus sonchifolius]|uniref:Uncharacterized protein n=1 Tax=Smallanthus sonchifolius TaxID=185202 RepID=A0ACB8Y4B3_9ASTR|nr:hypothetical protein L1987_86725 [Smallanthus sonchifolius]
MIGTIIFIFQPSLSITTTTTTYHINSHVMPSMPRSISISHHERTTIHRRPTGRVPVGVPRRRMRTVVTGGAGFVGSHLVDVLLARGDEVIVIDNLFTGRKENVAHHLDNPRFELIRHDVVQPILLEVDQIYHLACPASPVHYKYNPIKTIISFCQRNSHEFQGSNLLVDLKSQSVLPVIGRGVRSCYDEGKRTAETLTMDYSRNEGVEVRIARIFNTYGPRMCLDDGRVVSNFVSQALRKQPMTVYGDGKQTRSFQYVSDLVDGLVALMEGEHVGPFNLGNPGEFTMLELAQVVKETIDPNVAIEFRKNIVDDPQKRKPDISKAKELLNWEPKIKLQDGLPRMALDFKNRIFKEEQGDVDK